MTGQRHEGEGVLDALRAYTEDYEDCPSYFMLDVEEAESLLAYVESLETQINAHPPTEINPDA